MKKHFILTLCFYPFLLYSQEPLTPWPGIGAEKELIQETANEGIVYLVNGSIIKGHIEELPDKIFVTTRDGNRFVFQKNEVIRITWGKITSPKEPALAVVLSLIFPGVGNIYAGDSKTGALCMFAGVIGIWMIAFAEEFTGADFNKDVDFSLPLAGLFLYSGATVGSCIKAYYTAKSHNYNLTIISFKF